jgi:hypothetical protein
MSQPSLRTTSPPCLPLSIKDSLKKDAGLLLFGFLMGKAFGFRFSGFGFLGLWLFDVGGFWKGKELLKGEKELLKRIAKGELLARLRAEILRKQRENIGQCKSTLRTLYIGFRKAKLKKSLKEHGTGQI